MASREQVGPDDQPRRPARATGLPSRRIPRRQLPSQRWSSGGARPRQLVAAAFVVVVGVSLLWRARTAIEDAASARPPSIAVASPGATDSPAQAAAPTAIATDTPTALPATPSPTATTVVVATQAPAATIPAATSTPDAGAAAAPATAVPEPTPMAEEAPAEAEPPTPTPAPAQPAPAPAYRTYVVQRGDILKQIAARYGVSMASIMAINTIPNPDSLQVGQVLRIPPAGS